MTRKQSAKKSITNLTTTTRQTKPVKLKDLQIGFYHEDTPLQTCTDYLTSSYGDWELEIYRANMSELQLSSMKAFVSKFLGSKYASEMGTGSSKVVMTLMELMKELDISFVHARTRNEIVNVPSFVSFDGLPEQFTSCYCLVHDGNVKRYIAQHKDYIYYFCYQTS
ncbi:hypothetical protein C9374_006314 [Naegleria lovaniensis]|uniref:Uncharacterized protein n=1 Tax=Naegleria lovaniensis TaxID=51637 RepID=A0AA88GJK9_NAELO|nr:uncharacterized protein C9374_006314 [Naegleria lovaniensis]KAG2381325.1 hypothetical protein C9374_006314 [Naegleria lovaniensis]